MTLFRIFIISFLIAMAFTWWQSDNSINITLPDEGQRNEMIGTSNTPNIPLTPIKD
ncbi:hypothetical protein [Marinomonas sp. IMCC 4694]|uniref:hypothetical protein n=1 Tax=Marinomonas sp. IMCC 4694 TaxID=2605432 RepID=UPI0016531DFE|nr:hypothetical protein [Marinomonas sp. IMCC 4694]